MNEEEGLVLFIGSKIDCLFMRVFADKESKGSKGLVVGKLIGSTISLLEVVGGKFVGITAGELGLLS